MKKRPRCSDRRRGNIPCTIAEEPSAADWSLFQFRRHASEVRMSEIGHPYQPEYAIAAISESGHMIGPSQELLLSLGNEWLERQKAYQINEIKRKQEKYLKGRKEISVENKIAILVDDGIATGLTMQVGINELKDRHPKKIIVAVPVAPKSTAILIKAMVDDFVGIEIDDYDCLGAVGVYYEEFNQVEEEDVIEILNSEYNHCQDKNLR